MRMLPHPVVLGFVNSGAQISARQFSRAAAIVLVFDSSRRWRSGEVDVRPPRRHRRDGVLVGRTPRAMREAESTRLTTCSARGSTA